MTVRRTKLDVEHYDLGPLRLYREELRAIATAAGEAGDLAILCDGFEATSPEDFGDGMPEEPKNVTIKAANPDRLGTVEIRLSEQEAVIRLTEPDTLLAGVVSRVRLICEPRRRHIPSALLRAGRPGPFPIMFISCLFLVILAAPPVSWISHSHSRGHTATWLALIATSGVVVVGALFYGAFAVSRPWVEMINAPRADRPTYWQRTRDMWVVGVITAVLGAVAGYLLGRFG